MRRAVLVVLAVSGCIAPPAPPSAVEIARPQGATSLPSVAAVETAAPSADPAPAPPPEGCRVGAPVDASKLYEPVLGSFSGPGLDEMVGDLVCNPGGADAVSRVMLRRASGVWTLHRFLLRPDQQDTLRECQPLRTSLGRDLAICRRGSASYGTRYNSIVAFDYAKADDDEMSTLVALVDTRGAACDGSTDVVIGRLDGVALVDVDHDGNKDVRVTVRTDKVRVPPQPPCPEMNRWFVGAPPPNMPTPRPQTIDFIATGAALAPTPAGVRILKAIDTMKSP